MECIFIIGEFYILIFFRFWPNFESVPGAWIDGQILGSYQNRKEGVIGTGYSVHSGATIIIGYKYAITKVKYSFVLPLNRNSLRADFLDGFLSFPLGSWLTPQETKDDENKKGGIIF